jgi:hypothetical protein
MDHIRAREILARIVRESFGRLLELREVQVVRRASGRCFVGHDLAGVIITRFGELRSTHTADDVRRAMMKALGSCAAVTLRDHGGVYWVPAPYAETVRRLQWA